MIDQQLLAAYAAELEALRDHGREFAQSFPDIARRLDIGPQRSRDPHVERVVESTAFLAARMRLMIEEGAAELPQTLLALLAPTLAEPVPSMAVLELRGGSEPQRVARGARFDYELAGQAMACFSTTMDVTVHPMRLRIRRLEPSPGFADGIGIRITGQTPAGRLLLYAGSNRINAAELLNALDEALARVRVVAPNGRDAVTLAPTSLRMHGLAASEASLPVRPAVHPTHQ